MATFEKGRTYRTSFIGDHNSKIEITVVKRTAKIVTLTGFIEGRRRIHDFDGDEYVKDGDYSFAPSFYASEAI